MTASTAIRDVCDLGAVWDVPDLRDVPYVWDVPDVCDLKERP
ncbi:MAG: hypothetical protein M0Z95_06720 [Actinomycetota bacterium]|jgi:hypothetical protein|nr:hypothetical protein [Actinomycetota bacterium]